MEVGDNEQIDLAANHGAHPADRVRVRNMEISPDGSEIRLYLDGPDGVSAPLSEDESKALIQAIAKGHRYQGQHVQWRPGVEKGTLVYSTATGGKATCSLFNAAANYLAERIDWHVWCLLADHRSTSIDEQYKTSHERI